MVAAQRCRSQRSAVASAVMGWFRRRSTASLILFGLMWTASPRNIAANAAAPCVAMPTMAPRLTPYPNSVVVAWGLE